MQRSVLWNHKNEQYRAKKMLLHENLSIYDQQSFRKHMIVLCLFVFNVQTSLPHQDLETLWIVDCVQIKYVVFRLQN